MQTCCRQSNVRRRHETNECHVHPLASQIRQHAEEHHLVDQPHPLGFPVFDQQQPPAGQLRPAGPSISKKTFATYLRSGNLHRTVTAGPPGRRPPTLPTALPEAAHRASLELRPMQSSRSGRAPESHKQELRSNASRVSTTKHHRTKPTRFVQVCDRTCLNTCVSGELYRSGRKNSPAPSRRLKSARALGSGSRITDFSNRSFASGKVASGMTL